MHYPKFDEALKNEREEYYAIWKYIIGAKDLTTVEMPKGAQVLTVQAQGRNACVWVKCNPKSEQEERVFELLGTGEEFYPLIGYSRVYINTFQVGKFVFHLFERKPIEV